MGVAETRLEAREVQPSADAHATAIAVAWKLWLIQNDPAKGNKSAEASAVEVGRMAKAVLTGHLPAQ